MKQQADKPMEKHAAHPRAASQYGQDEWHIVQKLLREAVGESKFNQWLSTIAFGGWRENQIILHAPTKFLASWVNDHYGNKLRQCWRQLGAARGFDVLRVDVIHQTNGHFPARPIQTLPKTNAFAVETPIDIKLRFDNFVVGQSNSLAYQLACDLAKHIANDEPDSHQGVLFIHGDIGQGKTHLLHAIANQLKDSSAHPMMNLSAERFRYHFIRALRQDDMLNFKNHFSDMGVLIMDDLQFLSGKATQDEFFHILDLIRDNRGRLIVAATQPPTQLEKLDERIRSRLGGGLVVDIQPADYKLRQDIVRAKIAAHMPAIIIPPEIINFLVQHITANIRELEGALNRIIAHARHAQRPLEVDQARLILRDLLRAEQKRITVDEIQRKTAQYFDISIGDLLSARRQRAVARPRQIAMFLAKQLTPRSLPDIGRRFGGRDHTTVLHALRRIEGLCASDRRVESDVAALRQLCQKSDRRKPSAPYEDE